MGINQARIAFATGPCHDRADMRLVWVLVLCEPDVPIDAEYATLGVALNRKPWRASVGRELAQQALHRKLEVVIVSFFAGFEPVTLVVFRKVFEKRECGWAKALKIRADIVGKIECFCHGVV